MKQLWWSHFVENWKPWNQGTLMGSCKKDWQLASIRYWMLLVVGIFKHSWNQERIGTFGGIFGFLIDCVLNKLWCLDSERTRLTLLRNIAALGWSYAWWTCQFHWAFAEAKKCAPGRLGKRSLPACFSNWVGPCLGLSDPNLVYIIYYSILLYIIYNYNMCSAEPYIVPLKRL